LFFPSQPIELESHIYCHKQEGEKLDITACCSHSQAAFAPTGNLLALADITPVRAFGADGDPPWGP
jgi:hypothetical protein